MKKLTKAEEEIMQVVWAIGPCTVGDIRDYMERETQQDRPPHSTISTMVRILGEKGFLNHQAYGRTFVYSAAVSKEQYSQQSIRQLVQDYFGGSMNRLVSFLVREKDLNPDELATLLKKLDQEEEQ